MTGARGRPEAWKEQDAARGRKRLRRWHWKAATKEKSATLEATPFNTVCPPYWSWLACQGPVPAATENEAAAEEREAASGPIGDEAAAEEEEQVGER